MQCVALFDSILQTELPDDFTDMPPEDLQIMFPHEKRPQVIKGAPDGSYATFSLLEKTLSKQQLFVATYSVLSLLHKFYPSCDRHNVHIIPLEDNSNCGWFPFFHQGKKNILFIVAIAGKMVLGSCGCTEDDDLRFDEIKTAFLSLKAAPANEEAH